MQNINFHGARPKRSVQSLIEDSAIDNQQNVINFQILQIKKAYNQTYKSFSLKIQQLDAEISKYKERCKKLEEANVNLALRCQQFQQRTQQCNQTRLYCQKMKRKLQYVQGKYQKLIQNRSLVSGDFQNDERTQYLKWAVTGNFSASKSPKADKNQTYRQISQLINKKVKEFTRQMRLHTMSKQIQLKLQAFLEELIYITPISGGDAIKIQGFKDKQIGKISRKQVQNVLISEQQAWKDLQKSIQKLKKSQNTNKETNTPLRRQNLFNQSYSKKSQAKEISPFKNSNERLAYTAYNPHSKSKPRIFSDN